MSSALSESSCRFGPARRRNSGWAITVPRASGSRCWSREVRGGFRTVRVGAAFVYEAGRLTSMPRQIGPSLTSCAQVKESLVCPIHRRPLLFHASLGSSEGVPWADGAISCPEGCRFEVIDGIPRFVAQSSMRRRLEFSGSDTDEPSSIRTPVFQSPEVVWNGAWGCR